MINWIELTSKEEVDILIEKSYVNQVIIFKHSTSCHISLMSLKKIETSWDVKNVNAYYLDLKSYRDVSNYVSEKLDVYHESPQILLVHKGSCIYDESHLDINIEEIKEAMNEAISI